MSKLSVFSFALVIALVTASSATADVISAGAGGLIVRTTVEVPNAAPGDVYDALTRVSEWWSGTQTWSGNSRNLTLDPQVGGCLCEKLSSGGNVQIMRVVWAERGELLRLSGAPGRLQEGAAIATMSWRFSKTATGTKIELTFAASGYLPGGFDAIAPPTDKAFADLANRLAGYAGKPKP